QVLRVLHHLQPAAEAAPCRFGGSVGGGVVHEDHFESGPRLDEQRFEGIQQHWAPVPVDDDRADEGDGRRAHARPANSRVSVCTLTFSPSLMKSGTRIDRPVSSVASLVTPPLAVSPRTPGSVAVTVSSTWGGNCRPIGLPLYR